MNYNFPSPTTAIKSVTTLPFMTLSHIKGSMCSPPPSPCGPGATSASGFLVPMSNLFPGAAGSVRSVFLPHVHAEGSSPTEMCFYCIADVIRNVCEVGQERASEIWRFDTSDAFKNSLQTCTFAHCYALGQFIFHRSSVPVANLASILAIVNKLRGKKAAAFKISHRSILGIIDADKPSVSESKENSAVRPTECCSAATSADAPMEGEQVCDETMGSHQGPEVDSMECDDLVEDSAQGLQGTPPYDVRKHPVQNRTVNEKVRSNVEFLYGLFDRMLDTHDQMKKRGLPDTLCREMCGVMLDNARLIGSLTQDMGRNGMSSKAGFIYCLQSDAYPGMVKIGRSKNVSERLAALNTGCAPKPLRVVYKVPTMDAIRDEKRVHSHFASSRGEGEYFYATPVEVQKYLDTHVTPVYLKESQGMA